MNILFTVQAYSPASGGSEELVRQIATRLVRRGHSITVATSCHPLRPRNTVIDGVRVVSFDLSGNVVRGIKGSSRDEYVAFVAEGTWDCIVNYAAQTWSTDLILPELSRLRSAVVFAPCGFAAMRNLPLRVAYWRYFSSLKVIAATYTAWIFHSRLTRDWKVTRSWPIRKSVVIPNGVDASEFNGGPRTVDPFVVLHVGNHYRAKAHDRVIRAFQDADIPGSELWMLGQVPEHARSCLPRCSRCAMKDSRLKIFSGPSRSEVVAAFGRASVFLLASAIEAAPLVLLESMAAGIPFVSRNVGAVPDYPGGVTCASSTDLKSELRRLSRDPVARDQLGRLGRAYALQHDWNEIVDLYERELMAL